MRSTRKYYPFILVLLISLMLLPSCEDFLNPVQEIDITEDKLFDDWYEYRSAEMGLYGLQQQLVEQMVVLGELRADLLTITPNADADLVDVYNFDFSNIKTNKYYSPTNFFKLIAATNSFIRVLKTNHPEITDKQVAVTNFDKLYGEALCMRAWAYFNAVRIYGKVPFIHESLTTIEEIEDYVNTAGTYIDSVNIEFSRDGYYNDTLINQTVELKKKFFDQEMVIEHFTDQLENEIKAVGVDHSRDNNDKTWEVTIWSPWSLHALLGTMYLEQGDYVRANDHFVQITDNTTENLRYQLDRSFSGAIYPLGISIVNNVAYDDGNYYVLNSWKNIFTGIDNREHIFTLWFDKTYFQQNEFQSFFEPFSMDKYMLKPTSWAITNWEATWRLQVMQENLTNPAKSRMVYIGVPTDVRGFGTSYSYVKNGVPLTVEEYFNMINLRKNGDTRSSRVIMDGVDTIVYKYSVSKAAYDQDANFIIYRAASIHLYRAEIYTNWLQDVVEGRPIWATTTAVDIVNNGAQYNPNSSRPQLGVRGRVGLGDARSGIQIANIIYEHDPFSNQITGFKNLTNNFAAKQEMLESQILDERARELAFEGERFYDLMRIARRRGDPTFLANKVGAKYPGAKKYEMIAKLSSTENWYVPYFKE